jgi:hypothetical protein
MAKQFIIAGEWTTFESSIGVSSFVEPKNILNRVVFHGKRWQQGQGKAIHNRPYSLEAILEL